MFDKIISFIRRKILRDPKARWNHNFAKGRWDNLRESKELARIEMTADFVRRYTRKGTKPRILEIGCGEGFFRQYFKDSDFSYFLGTDIADVAITNANEWFGDAKTRFEAQDMDKWLPEDKYDFIVFNECVYHSRNQRQLMERFATRLNEGGYFIVSVHRNFKQYLELWDKVMHNNTKIDEGTISNEQSTWDVRVLQLK